MPFANVSTGGFTNSAGIYNCTSGTVTSTLAGQYVKITDTCGAISQASDATGNIAFGTSTGTDCTTPGQRRRGQHPLRPRAVLPGQPHQGSRSAAGCRPTPGSTSSSTVNVNLNQTCNAYWNGSTLNFFKSGGGCANTGEIAGVSLHEFGHGIDQNDGTGTAPTAAPASPTATPRPLIALHDSCIGRRLPAPATAAATATPAPPAPACATSTSPSTPRTPRPRSDNFTQRPLPRRLRRHRPLRQGSALRVATSPPRRSGTSPTATCRAPAPAPAWTILDRLWYLSRNTATNVLHLHHRHAPSPRTAAAPARCGR